MTSPLDDVRREVIQTAFRMPTPTNIAGRISSVTNAFVISVIPEIVPTAEEILEGLALLGMVPENIRCTYCGAAHNTWDHLRPLVIGQRPTGFISEIGNLVPACGPCNSSKGNQDWRKWMLGNARLSPTGRKLQDVAERIARVEAYERWRPPTRIDFEALVGKETWEHLWSLSTAINLQLREAQAVADAIRSRVDASLRKS
jgi:hypothetical protein